MNKLDYPLNLVCAIYGISSEELEKLPAYSLAENNVDEVLSGLTEREHNVLVFRYKENLSTTEIGRHYGVIPERIKQIERKALRKLRHPSRSKKLGFNTLDILNQKLINADEKIRDFEQIISDMKIQLFLLSKDDEELISYDDSDTNEVEIRTLTSNGIMTYGDLKQTVQPLLNTYSSLGNEFHLIVKKLEEHDLVKLLAKDELLLVDIDELNLSVRTINCLRRFGINTVFDFLNKIKSFEDLAKIRNLGRRSAAEIINQLNTRGCDVSYLLQDNQTEKLPVLAVEKVEETTTEDKLSALQAENELLKAKLARCKELLKSGIEEL